MMGGCSRPRSRTPRRGSLRRPPSPSQRSGASTSSSDQRPQPLSRASSTLCLMRYAVFLETPHADMTSPMLAPRAWHLAYSAHISSSSFVPAFGPSCTNVRPHAEHLYLWVPLAVLPKRTLSILPHPVHRIESPSVKTLSALSSGTHAVLLLKRITGW